MSSTRHLVSPTSINAQTQRPPAAGTASVLPSTDLSSTTMRTFDNGHPPRSPESSTSELAATSPPHAVSLAESALQQPPGKEQSPQATRTTIICRLHAVTNRRRAETQEINSRPYELSRQVTSLEPESGPIASLVEVQGTWKRRSRKLFSEGHGSCHELKLDSAPRTILKPRALFNTRDRSESLSSDPLSLGSQAPLWHSGLRHRA